MRLWRVFSRSLQSECLASYRFATRRAAENDVLDYITYYNYVRLHSTLGYRSPKDHENDRLVNAAKKCVRFYWTSKPEGLVAYY